jgi:hypothetical protein
MLFQQVQDSFIHFSQNEMNYVLGLLAVKESINCYYQQTIVPALGEAFDDLDLDPQPGLVRRFRIHHHSQHLYFLALCVPHTRSF